MTCSSPMNSKSHHQWTAKAAPASPRAEAQAVPAAALLSLTGGNPRAALAAARSVLAAKPGPHDASIAHQAAAIVLRDFGDVAAAIREFRVAARLAGQAADPDREADVLTSLGTALVMAGRTEAGMAALDGAVATVSRAAPAGAELGRIL